MKKIYLLFTLLLFTLLSCGTPKEVSFENKKLKYADNIVTYSGKPYTGKIALKGKDKTNNMDGYFNVKDGHLDNTSQLKGNINGENIDMEFTVKDNIFDGKYYAMVGNFMSVEALFENSHPKFMKANVMNGMMEQNMEFDKDYNINGNMKLQGQNFEIKNGEITINGQKMMLVYDSENHILITRVYNGDEINQEIKEQYPPKVELLEKYLFGLIINKIDPQTALQNMMNEKMQSE